jgi:Cu2+-exporting ATPase
MVGIGKGAENNILIKDAEALEMTYKMNAIVLDKTGTVTEGKLAVREVRWASDINEKQSADILFSLEKSSEHPLAEAVVAYFKDRATNVALENVSSVTGRGITGIYKGKKYLAGGIKILIENGLKIDAGMEELNLKWEGEANTVIYFADEEKVLAILSLSDRIKENSIQAVKQLKDLGIDVYLVTGDNRKTAETVAGQTGIPEFRAEYQPSEKADFIALLQRQGKTVGMVGDGINDSLALATADVSIAMGKGSDIAIDASKMTIISNDLSIIPSAIKLSRNTVRTIRQNLFWAFIYNVIGIPVAAGVLFPLNGFLLNPMIAGAAMALSSVSVVSNSLRLRYSKII